MGKYKDLFKSTAPYYIRYRNAYPESLFECLREKFRLTKEDWVLDLGCGPGPLAIPIASFVERVIAVDPEPEMIAEGKNQAALANAENVTWLKGSSEDLPGLTEAFHPFKLVTMGRSFHWMDREQTLRDLYEIIVPGGGIAIIANSTHWNEIRDEAEQSLHNVYVKHLGERRRAGSGYFEVTDRKHEEVVKNSPFSVVEQWSDTFEKTGTADDIIGYNLSTSKSSLFVLGDAAADFERDMREVLYHISPSGEFTGQGVVNAILAWKRD